MDNASKENTFNGLEIAVIGMSGRFPGAKNVEQFWENLRNGVESISFFTNQELEDAGIEPLLFNNTYYVRARAILENPEYFDASFFGISPREAEIMDPQHRLFLECAWEALENAGYDAERYTGSIGVYAGIGMNTYLLNNLIPNRGLVEIGGEYQAFIGNDKDFASTRVSYKLNLRGPSIAIQTACSTSLVAVHLAGRALLGGECDLALAGGVTISVPQKAGYMYQESGISSPDGHCRAFDASAEGTVFGNGGAVVVLKRLADALDEGDNIYAIIKGSAINNDGSMKPGYTAPSIDGQSKAIRMAQIMADTEAASITYIETHGTGTSLGDPIEIAALSQAFRVNTQRNGFCAIGSVKTNIGHLDTAAGVAGLIKTVMALKHQVIPPSLHFKQPNPNIDFANSPFYVNTSLSEWKTDRTPRRAGVSSFGIGGTNAHVVLEEAPIIGPSGASRPWQLLMLSAETSTALEAATANLARHLKQQPALDLADVAYTLQVGRKVFRYQRVCLCQTPADAVIAMETLDPKQVFTGASVQESRNPPVVFMFSGQGTQYMSMAADLYRLEPAFQEHVDRCSELLRPHLGLDLRAVLYPTEVAIDDRRVLDGTVEQNGRWSEISSRRLDQTWLAQPALFVVAYALAKLWMAWGVQPESMIGHSVGEYVAACLAGVFSLEDALALIAIRGRLMQDLPGGSMVAVSLPERELRPLLGDQIGLAAINGPALCVVSGPTEAVEKLAQYLTEQGVNWHRLHTSHAFHSAMVDPILGAFTKHVSSKRLNPPQIPYISNVTGTWITAGEATDPNYWSRHLRQTVHFADGISDVLQDRARVFLEVGPGQVLSILTKQHSAKPYQPLVLASVRSPQDPQPDMAFLLQSLGRLWLAGVAIDWPGFYAREQRYRVSLPTYPFERQRCWIEAGKSSTPGPQSQLKKQNIANWFFIPSWKRTIPPLRVAQKSESRWLIFSDGGSLSVQLGRQLASMGNSVVSVMAGEWFAANDDMCIIRPGHRDDYGLLLAALDTRSQMPTHIVHLWNLTPLDGSSADVIEAIMQRGFYSLLFLAQALGKQEHSDNLRLAVVSANMQKVAGEEVIHPEKAALLGPCKVIPQEMPHIACCSIDIKLPVPESYQESQLVEQIVAELEAQTSDRVIAYRGYDRWVQTHEPVQLAEIGDLAGHKLREQGVYLIIGGLGGIGLALAEYLFSAVRAKLVLTTRTRFPDPQMWEEWLITHHPQDRTSSCIRAIQALQASGAELLVMHADVTDRIQMRAVVRATEEHYGALHGVVHAAGIPGGGLIQFKTAEAAAHVLAPKVQGTRVLADVLRDVSIDFLVLCSSITAITGGIGQVDYCAANAYMDAFAYAQTERPSILTVSINWDAWAEVGLAVNTPLNYTTSLPRRTRTTNIVDHPLINCVHQEALDRIIYEMRLSPEEHWVLSEHLVMGIPVVPGTAYLDLARYAFEGIYNMAQFEISEAIFTIPLMVGHNDTKEVQFILEKQDSGFDFRVMSKMGVTASQEALWQTHLTGQTRRLRGDKPQEYDIEEIQKRCSSIRERKDDQKIDDSEEFLSLGPRWSNSFQCAYIGNHEGLILFELDELFISDLERFKLHPALLDIATGYGSTLGNGHRYLPLSYGHMRVYDRIPNRFYSYVRLYPNSDIDGETLNLQIALINEAGKCILDIEKFVMKRVGQATANRLLGLIDTSSPTNVNPRYPSNQNRGILTAEGCQAFHRILSLNCLPQIAVCTQHLPTLIEQFDRMNQIDIVEAAVESRGIKHIHPELHQAQVAPRNDIEERVASIWRELLGIANIDIHDNFFDLGGHSLMATQLLSKVRDIFGVRLSISSIFEKPTILELAQAIVEEQLESIADSPLLDAVLSEVESLSRDEIHHLLEREDVA